MNAVIVILLCLICFLTGLTAGVFTARKIKRELWEALEVINVKIDNIQKRLK